MGNTFNTGRLINGLFVDASGNVGIGTTTPAEKLSVIGNIRIDNGAADGGQLVLASSGFSDWNLDNFSGRFRAYYGATEYFTINASGNVGIGTSSIVGKLDINTGGNRNIVISNDSVDTGYNIISLNGTRTKGSYAGIAGGGTGDNNLYLNSGSNIVFQTGASYTARMAITSSGNVGIGLSNPTALLEILGAQDGVANKCLRLAYNGTYYGEYTEDSIRAYNNPLIFGTGTGGTEKMRIGADGRVFIGIAGSSNGHKLEINAGSQSALRIDVTSGFSAIAISPGGEFNIDRPGLGGGAFKFTSGGDLLVGKNALGWTVPGLQTEANGTNLGITNPNSSNNLFIRKNDATGTMIQFWYNNSSVGSVSISTSSTSYNTSSDYRLKEDLKQINGLQKVSEIKVYDFQWKSDKTRMDGVLAHELAEVLPYAVYGEKDGEEMQGVDYSKIVPVLVKAIQEQQEIINNLSAKVTALENK